METRTAILEYADSRNSFRFSDLLTYLNTLFEISKVTLSWYLRQMVDDSRLFKIGRGIYTTRSSKRVEYNPIINKTAKKIGKELKTAFPFVDFSLFCGETLAIFQHHHSTNNSLYIEVERDAVEPVFHFLKKRGYKTYINPTKDFVYDYIEFAEENIIVKPLVSESPLMEFNGIKTPRIEKLLVDILCDDDFDYLHGSEWHYMMRNALNLVAVNQSRMLRYASRRNAKEKVREIIQEIYHD